MISCTETGKLDVTVTNNTNYTEEIYKTMQNDTAVHVSQKRNYFPTCVKLGVRSGSDLFGSGFGSESKRCWSTASDGMVNAVPRWAPMLARLEMDPSAFRILMLWLGPMLTGREVTDPSLGPTAYYQRATIYHSIQQTFIGFYGRATYGCSKQRLNRSHLRGF